MCPHRITPSNYVYLYDRIMVKEQGKQYYGTQFRSAKDKELFPIVDAAKVNERRQALRLGTMEEYIKTVMGF